MAIDDHRRLEIIEDFLQEADRGSIDGLSLRQFIVRTYRHGPPADLSEMLNLTDVSLDAYTARIFLMAMRQQRANIQRVLQASPSARSQATPRILS